MAGGGPGSSLIERALGAAVLLLLAAIALRAAVQIVLSVLWPLIGVALVSLGIAIGWRYWMSRRGGW